MNNLLRLSFLFQAMALSGMLSDHFLRMRSSRMETLVVGTLPFLALLLLVRVIKNGTARQKGMAIFLGLCAAFMILGLLAFAFLKLPLTALVM